MPKLSTLRAEFSVGAPSLRSPFQTPSRVPFLALNILELTMMKELVGQ